MARRNQNEPAPEETPADQPDPTPDPDGAGSPDDGTRTEKPEGDDPHASQQLQSDQAPAGDPTQPTVNDPRDKAGADGDLATKPPSTVTEATGDATVHQEGAPAKLAEAVDESKRLGFVAPEQNALKPEKPDYSQANPAVMNRA